MVYDSNLTTTQARHVFRHLRIHFGRSIFPSMEKVASVTNGFVHVLSPPLFWTYKYYDKIDNILVTKRNCSKKKKKKKPELVKIWTRDACEAIAYEFKLLIDESRKDGGVETFGYDIDDGSFGVNVIVGSDHGGGSSQLLAKVNYLPASKRREESGKIENGSRVIQYGCVKCRKDKAPILLEVAPALNKTLQDLDRGCLVGFEDEEANIDVAFVPKAARKTVKTEKNEGNIKMKFVENEEIISKDLKHLKSEAVRIWTVIENFYYNIAGDVAYFHTLQGRDGTSSCRCPYCPLTIREWKMGLKAGKLTKEMLLKGEKKYFKYLKDFEEAKKKGKRLPVRPNTHGVSGKVQCDADPLRYIIPLLHLLIGLLNKALQEFRDWLDVHVELIEEEEMNLRRKSHSIFEKVSEIQARMDHLMNEKERCYDAKDKLIDDLLLEGGKDAGKEEEIKEIDDYLLNLKEEYDDLEIERREHKAKEATIKKGVKEAKEDRIGDEDGIDTKINEILRRRAHITPQAFHGGQLNGVDCRRLLNQLEGIIEEIKEVAEERLSNNIDKFPNDVEISMSELRNKLDSYSNLFSVMDVVFSLLRTPAPTEEEVKEAEEAIFVLQTMWKALDISETVKAHILFVHTIEQFQRVGGIADRVEDFIEKYHQKIKRLDHLTARMPNQCFREQQLTQIRRIHGSSHPTIQKQTAKIEGKARRKFKAPRRETEKSKKKKAKIQARDKTKNSSYYKNILKDKNN